MRGTCLRTHLQVLWHPVHHAAEVAVDPAVVQVRWWQLLHVALVQVQRGDVDVAQLADLDPVLSLTLRAGAWGSRQVSRIALSTLTVGTSLEKHAPSP